MTKARSSLFYVCRYNASPTFPKLVHISLSYNNNIQHRRVSTHDKKHFHPIKKVFDITWNADTVSDTQQQLRSPAGSRVPPAPAHEHELLVLVPEPSLVPGLAYAHPVRQTWTAGEEGTQVVEPPIAVLAAERLFAVVAGLVAVGLVIVADGARAREDVES